MQRGRDSPNQGFALLRDSINEGLNARIDEAEEEIERGEGKSFDEMMAGFRKELLWLK